MKKIFKLQVLAICLIFSLFSCGETEKTEKQKLIVAFEQYVNGLTVEEMKEFDVYKKGGVESLDGTSEGPTNSYYDIKSSSFEIFDLLTGINDLKKAEEGFKGRSIFMKSAKDWCKFEHDRRLDFREEDPDSIEQSVYFAFGNIKSWLDDVKAKYPDTPPVGFRAYFAGYPNDVTVQGKTLFEKNRSTIVLRAMYLGEKNSKPAFFKIPLNPIDTGTIKDILTFDLGGLCPPNCHDDPEI